MTITNPRNAFARTLNDSREATLLKNVKSLIGPDPSKHSPRRAAYFLERLHIEAGRDLFLSLNRREEYQTIIGKLATSAAFCSKSERLNAKDEAEAEAARRVGAILAVIEERNLHQARARLILHAALLAGILATLPFIFGLALRVPETGTGVFTRYALASTGVFAVVVALLLDFGCHLIGSLQVAAKLKAWGVHPGSRRGVTWEALRWEANRKIQKTPKLTGSVLPLLSLAGMAMAQHPGRGGSGWKLTRFLQC